MGSKGMRTRTKLFATTVLVVLTSGDGLATTKLQRSPSSRHQAMVLPSPAVRQANDLSSAFVAIADAVTPAVVRIQAEHQASAQVFRRIPGHEFLDPERDGAPEIAGGTGFIVTGDGYILTNNHVVDGAQRITVTLEDRRQFAARMVGRDPTTDVAVIKIEGKGLPAAPLGDSDEAKVGEWVLAIGNPGFGEGSTLDFTVTNGIVSAKGRPLEILRSSLGRGPAAGFAIEDFIQTDAAINPGNSGGPLVDLTGKVIGINSAIASETGYNEGYGFAIPINLARKVMKDLVEQGRVRRPVMGVNIDDVDDADAEVFRLPSISGVLIQGFSGPQSPAQKAGMQLFDVIVSIDGQPVDRMGELQRLVAQHQPGDVVEVALIRYGERRSLRVPLIEADLPAAPTAAASTAAGQGLGLDVSEVAPPGARRSAGAGVFISRVQPFSVAARKQLEIGDRVVQINRVPITSVEQARSLIRSAHSGQVLSIYVEQARAEGRTHIFNVRVP